mgnify:CR=1 FL=1
MTYEKAVTYILDIPKFTKKNDPAHTKMLLRLLGNPQEAVKVIHVAGTNGKGSVCAYLDAMLRSEGRRTGLFTSPHLVKMNERIVIDGCPISDDAFVFVFEKILSCVRRMEEEGLPHPTFFEFLFAMAAAAFAEAGVEYAVLETGMGGRLDATNTVERPLVSVITSIGMDHMEYLGHTLKQIAGEKAGIIKPGVPVLFAETSPESDGVIERTAEKRGSLCKKIGKDAYEILGIEDKHIAFSCSNAYYGNTTWKLNNIGAYQPGNAVLAMEVMRYLFGEAGHPQRWRQVLAELKWAGRMEEILPGVYIDGAHNISAVEAFAESVPQNEKGNIILFSAVRDKEYEAMIECLCRRVQADFYVVTLISDRRAAEAGTLGKLFEKYTDRPVVVIESAEEALRYVLSHRGGRTVYCLGSLYLTGMIKSLIQEVISC